MLDFVAPIGIGAISMPKQPNDTWHKKGDAVASSSKVVEAGPFESMPS
jgi:hypothetical protein